MSNRPKQTKRTTLSLWALLCCHADQWGYAVFPKPAALVQSLPWVKETIMGPGMGEEVH